MKKLLITGFDPFGGECINPAWEAVKQLPDEIGAYRLHKVQIPTVFGVAAQSVLDVAKKEKPDAILCIGQAGGRAAVTPEYVAINLRHAGICDNAGKQPLDEPVVKDAPKAYFSTLPVRQMEKAIEAAGIRAAVSYSAGTFVCNDVLYTLLHFLPNTPTGFVHVPFLPEQAKEGVACMPLSEVVRALEAAIQVL